MRYTNLRYVLLTYLLTYVRTYYNKIQTLFGQTSENIFHEVT